MKYFASYAVGGCLWAIAFSSFMTDLARLVPALVPICLIGWGIAAIISGIVIKLSGLQKALLDAWIWGNVLIGLGVVCGLR